MIEVPEALVKAAAEPLEEIARLFPTEKVRFHACKATPFKLTVCDCRSQSKLKRQQTICLGMADRMPPRTCWQTMLAPDWCVRLSHFLCPECVV